MTYHPAASTASEGQNVLAARDALVAMDLNQALKNRVLVVEDHPFVRRGLVTLINHQADLTCCGEADTVAATPALVEQTRPNLVLLDLQLKDADSYDLISFLTAEFPSIPILIVSQSAEPACADRALRAGARGYVSKQDAVEELLSAVSSVLQGKRYLSRELAARLRPTPH